MKLQNLKFCLGFLVLFTFLMKEAKSQTKYQKFIEFKNKMEKKVTSLSTALKKKYQQDCTAQLLECKTKSYNYCNGTGERECITNFPTPSNCLGSGIRLSNSSALRIPDNYNTNLRAYLVQFACTSALIQDVFYEIQKDNQIQFSYAYIGSSSGALRVYPSFKDIQNRKTGTCFNFDPRKRPWYVSAITGAKTTIILFDISRSMTSLFPESRFSNGKVTLQIVINTLNSFDKVGLVLFSGKVKDVGFPNILQANDFNKNALLKVIEELDVDDGGTNYTAAFEAGLNMLKGLDAPCNQIIFLLLTDGYFQNDHKSLSLKTLEDMISYRFTSINRTVDQLKLISFIYGLQNNINYTFVNDLTCLFDGIIFRMWDGITQFQMVQKLTNYYIFLSEGVDPQSIKPVWSMPYIDAFGFGSIVSVTMPIYIGERKQNRLIGVAAIDVLMTKFLQFQYNQSEIINMLESNKPKCIKMSLQQDQLCFIRKKQSNLTCDPSKCTSEYKLSKRQLCVMQFQKNIIIFKKAQDESEDESRCCIMRIQTFYAILFSSIGFGILVIIFIILYKSNKLGQFIKKCKKQKSKETQSSKSSLIGDRNLIEDPQEKYKKAHNMGIMVYYQNKFKFQ